MPHDDTPPNCHAAPSCAISGNTLGGGLPYVTKTSDRTARPRESRALQSKYRWTARAYDILDYYWERQYRKWRPGILADLKGDVLELGVGTGRNLEFYPPHVCLTAVDLSPHMLARARRRARKAQCPTRLLVGDVTDLRELPDAAFDWVISLYLCCVLADALHSRALAEIERVLRPGGRFRLLEMLYSQQPALRRRQERFAPFVEWIYGARFDRRTREHLDAQTGLRVTATRFLKADTIARCISKPANNTSTGTTMKPPPTPSKPASRPVTRPAAPRPIKRGRANADEDPAGAAPRSVSHRVFRRGRAEGRAAGHHGNDGAKQHEQPVLRCRSGQGTNRRMRRRQRPIPWGLFPSA